MKYSLLILFLMISVVEAQNQRSSSGSDIPEEYQVIVSRNIFLRERQRPREPSTQPVVIRPVETPPDVPERRFVLRGVVLEDEGIRAYFENGSGQIVKVSPGNPIATGYISQIMIDTVTYVLPDGEVRRIEIGQNLEGTRVSVSTNRTGSSGTSSSSTSGGASTGATGANEIGNLSLEERMRLRRQQGR
ncbi:MAG: hypothetical protein KatS3mg104_1937 [Phycisphaerae bacterium]|jgi:hypothetical protein|nr:MAG: hypothetical protein KatS3mg104_1937 [Phycisphaerae bacterium]